MSDDIIANLRKRYAEPEIPPCRVCGRKLSLGAIIQGTKFWYCDTDDLRHWAQSEVVRQLADPDVIALCDEVERLRTIISEFSESLDPGPKRNKGTEP